MTSSRVYARSRACALALAGLLAACGSGASPEPTPARSVAARNDVDEPSAERPEQPSVAQPNAGGEGPVQAYLRGLPDRLGSHDAAQLDAIEASTPPAAGTIERHSDGGWTLTLAEPVSARWLADAMGWERPLAVSTDVHQRSFSIQLFDEDLDAHRVSSRRPTIGAWSLDPVLVARPEGELPTVQAGASPAYDLRARDAMVRRIRFDPAG